MSTPPDKEEVVLVHGLWFGGWAMARLAQHLRQRGFLVRHFNYRSTAAGIDVHAADLLQFVRTTSASTMHLLGHSMGGLVILKMLTGEPDLPPGRVVLLGTPLQGSQTARKALQLPGSGAFFGRAATDLCQGHPQPVTGRAIGVIAGSRAVGLGRLLGQHSRTSDGTVALSETLAPGLSARLVLPVSHTGMLFSAEVAREVSHFFEFGQFSSHITGA
jgi:pimeloyl-ACP methyl ester carboxylesterase